MKKREAQRIEEVKQAKRSCVDEDGSPIERVNLSAEENTIEHCK